MLPSPQSMQESPPASRTRQVRLRSACNQCCAAKVKCSGEKTGCERCQSTGSSCVYVESRVGKVPGIRAKRKQAATHEPQRPYMKESFSGDRSSTPNIASAAELGFRHNEPDTAIEWATDWHFNPSVSVGTDFTDPSTIHAAPNTSNEDLSVSPDSATALNSNEEFSMIMNVNLDDLLMCQQSNPSPTDQLEGSPTTPKALVPLGLRPRNEVDSQCCLEACQVISDLENYIMSELKAFKLILGIVKKALEKLVHLMDVQQSSRNLRCLMLFNTMMYQVLELLEVCLSTVASEEARQRSRSLTGGSSGLGFGDFSMDVEEQSAFRVQTILKEVQQTIEVLGKLRTLAGIGMDPSLANDSQSVQGKARGDCYLDLEIRLRDLAVRCKKR